MKAMSINLIANSVARKGDILRADGYSGDEYAKSEDVQFLIDNTDSNQGVTIDQIVVCFEIKWEKAHKENRTRANNRLVWWKKQEPAHLCPVVALLAHALRNDLFDVPGPRCSNVADFLRVAHDILKAEVDRVGPRAVGKINWHPEVLKYSLICKLSTITREASGQIAENSADGGTMHQLNLAKPMNIGNVKWILRGMCEDAGVTVFNRHALRRGWAREIANLPESERSGGLVNDSVIDTLNHSDAAVRKGVTESYVGPSETFLAAAVARTGGYLSRLDERPPLAPVVDTKIPTGKRRGEHQGEGRAEPPKRPSRAPASPAYPQVASPAPVFDERILDVVEVQISRGLYGQAWDEAEDGEENLEPGGDSELVFTNSNSEDSEIDQVLASADKEAAPLPTNWSDYVDYFSRVNITRNALLTKIWPSVVHAKARGDHDLANSLIAPYTTSVGNRDEPTVFMFKCPVCDNRNNHKHVRDNHYRKSCTGQREEGLDTEDQEELELVCDVEGCKSKTVFTTQHDLDVHKRNNHEWAPRACSEPGCGPDSKIYTNRSTFLLHQRSHREFVCNYKDCNASFSRIALDAIRNHVVDAHGTSASDPLLRFIIPLPGSDVKTNVEQRTAFDNNLFCPVEPWVLKQSILYHSRTTLRDHITTFQREMSVQDAKAAVKDMGYMCGHTFPNSNTPVCSKRYASRASRDTHTKSHKD